MSDVKLIKVHDYLWEIPKEGKMRVPGRIYASADMLDHIRSDNAHVQVRNVAQMPGIVKFSLAMPDIHWGYGFPIGGVAAFDVKDGVISPGGVGYDINCGVRLMRTALHRKDVEGKIRDLVNAIFANVPSGVGSTGKIRLTVGELKHVLLKGAMWAVENGYGLPEDLRRIEENGCMEGADPSVISQRAMERGRAQIGTIGSGNHFVEIEYVDEIYDEKIAKVLGLEKDMITITVHTGSRGFGYQVCDDYLDIMMKALPKYGFDLPDRQLVCVPIDSPEGKNYYAAMVAAVNYAFANREAISHWTREAFAKALGTTPSAIGLETVYEVAHNIAKIEEHIVDGKPMKVCVHRKGATRAFPPGHPDIPEEYREIGQPVLIPGDMGRYSYVLVGTKKAMEETFGSTCHGAGRVMSRNQAIRASRGRSIERELEAKGIIVRGASRETMAEEIPDAYKDVASVADAVHGAGISIKVARLRPLGCVKG
jgi:tRNA-splicing ligase RtcB